MHGFQLAEGNPAFKPRRFRTDACTATIHAERPGTVPDALDHDEPSRAHREHVIANPLGGVPPVYVMPTALCPRARMRPAVMVGMAFHGVSCAKG